MHFDSLGFETDYEVTQLTAMPENGLDYDFKLERELNLKQPGLAIEIITKKSEWPMLSVDLREGRHWTAQFEPGPEGITGVYGTPSPTTFCIIVNGQAFYVPIKQPEQYSIVPSFPVKSVFPIHQKGLIIFVDYCRLVAFNDVGHVWTTDDLSWDGISIVEIGETEIKGVSWNAANNKDVFFSVDVLTGRHQGGASHNLRAGPPN